MPMTPERWKYLSDYADEVFGHQDQVLTDLQERFDAAGLPTMAISADVGRFLQILVSLTPGRLAIELGTLAGYSAIWIARGLSEDGKLITVEYQDRHSDFAQRELDTAGLADKVEIVRGPALDVIPDLLKRFGPRSVDFVFIDAVKEEYVAYFDAMREMIAVGGLVVADNVYGTAEGWIDEGYGTDDFNRLLAADPDFEATATPMRAGLLIARRTR